MSLIEAARAALELEPCDDGKMLRSQLSYDPNSGEMRIARSGRGLVFGRVIGSVNCRGYVLFTFKGKNHKVHRLAWLHFYGHWPQYEIDHINGVKTDNRIANLRDVPRHVNIQNRRTALSTNKINVLGVIHLQKSNKWTAQITIDGKKRQIGTFPSAKEASDAYIAAKRQFHQGCTL